MKAINYELGKEIGTGNFSKVFKATNKETNQTFALKIMNSHRSIARKEAELLGRLKHPNIVSCYHYVEDNDGYQLFLEYLPTNALTLYQQSICGLKEDQVKCILFQVALGLAYLHGKGVIHRDIKPENILIDKSKAIIKIIDLGLAIGENDMQTDYIATRWYRSPENLLCTKQYTTAIDVFSLGCVIAQLYSGDPLFPGANNLDQIGRIFQVLGYPTKQTWKRGFQKVDQLGIQSTDQRPNIEILKNALNKCDPKLLDLIQKMLILNPKDRISAQDVVKHSYFNDVREIVPPVVYDRFKKDILSKQGPPMLICEQITQNEQKNQNKTEGRGRDESSIGGKTLLNNQSSNNSGATTNINNNNKEGYYSPHFSNRMNPKMSLREFKLKDHHHYQTAGSRPLEPVPTFVKYMSQKQKSLSKQKASKQKPKFLVQHNFRMDQHSHAVQQHSQPQIFHPIVASSNNGHIFPMSHYQTNPEFYQNVHNQTLHYSKHSTENLHHISAKTQEQMQKKSRRLDGQHRISLEKRISEVEYIKPSALGVTRPQFLDRSSPPQLIRHLDFSGHMPLKSIESAVNIRKVSQNDIEKRELIYTDIKPHKNSSDSMPIRNLTMVESRHHRAIDSIPQVAERSLSGNKRMFFENRRESMQHDSRKDTRLSPAYRQLSLTKNYSPKYKYQLHNSSHNRVSYQTRNLPSFQTALSKAHQETLEQNSRSSSLLNEKKSLNQQKTKSPISNYSDIKHFINKKASKNNRSNGRKQNSKAIRSQFYNQESSSGGRGLNNFANVPMISSVPMPPIEISLKSPINDGSGVYAQMSSTAQHKNQLLMNQNGQNFISNRRKNEQKGKNSFLGLERNEVEILSNRPSHKTQYTSTINISQTNNHQQGGNYELLGHRIKNGKMTIDTHRETTSGSGCVSPKNSYVKHNQFTNNKEFPHQISSPGSNNVTEKNFYPFKNQISSNGNRPNPNPEFLNSTQPGNLKQFSRLNTSPRVSNAMNNALSPRIFKPNP